MYIAGLDLETTGLSHVADGITEIGLCVKKIEDKPKKKKDPQRSTTVFTYGSLNDPGILISKEASQVTGLTDADISGFKIDYNLVHSWLAKADYIVAHNAFFDMNFLIPIIDEIDKKLKNETRAAEPKKWLDSMSMVDWRERIPNSKSLHLNYIAADLGLLNRSAHRAVDDAVLMLDIIDRASMSSGNAIDEMIKNRARPWYKIKALKSSRGAVGALKQARYMAKYENGNFQYWYKFIIDDGDTYEAEMRFLATEVYGATIPSGLNAEDVSLRIPAAVTMYEDWWKAVADKNKTMGGN